MGALQKLDQRNARAHVVLRAVLALPEFWPGKNLSVLLRNGHRQRPKRCASREKKRECQIPPRPRAEEFHLEAPVGIGDGIAEVAYGGAEPERIPLAAAPWLDRGDEYAAIGTVAQGTGIDRDAISTTVQAVIRSAGCVRAGTEGSTARRRPGQRIGAPPPGAAPTSFPPPGVTASSWLSRSSP
jgi:hypothetical protein